jgi:hypothetical protein
MAIRINLLAEAQAAEELRRKDPVKRAALGAGLLISLVLIWSLTLQSKIIIANSELRKQNMSWQAIERQHGWVQTNQIELARLERNLAALQQFRTNRFLWGSFLDMLQHTVVDDVAITRVKVEQLYALTEGTPDKTNELRVVKGRPAVATERIVLMIDAHDFTRNSTGRTRFKEAMANAPIFQGSVQKTNVTLFNVGAPIADPRSPTGTAVPFTLHCFVPEKERTLQ